MLVLLSRKSKFRNSPRSSWLRSVCQQVRWHLTLSVSVQVNREVKNPHFRSNCDRDEVTQKELLLLAPGKWLNDEVINFYGAMLLERAKKEGKRKIHFFNSFFYTKILKDGYEKSKIGRWTKKVRLATAFAILG